jgi:histidyl-tRNA synthetase
MESTRAAALVLARELRRAFAVECDAEGRSVGAQLKAADKAGARVVVLVGEEEWGRGEVAVKDLENGSQRALPRAGLEEALQRLLREKRETQER